MLCRIVRLCKGCTKCLGHKKHGRRRIILVRLRPDGRKIQPNLFVGIAGNVG